MIKKPYKEEELRYLQLKTSQLFEERAQQIRKEKGLEIHSLIARGMHGSGMANQLRKQRILQIQKARLQSIVDAHFSLWEVRRIVPNKEHFDFLKEAVLEGINVEMVLEEIGSEFVRLGNRIDIIEKQKESLKYDLGICTQELLRDAEVKFYELRGTIDRKPKIFISADQEELEGVRSAIKSKIELEYPKQFDIFVFEGEVPDGDPPEEFYSKNLISADI